MNILKKSVSFLTAVVVLILSAVIIADFPESNNVVSAYSIDSYADDVAALVNEYRQEQGIEPLKVIPALQKNAQTRAVEISEEFSHTRPDGTLCFTAISSSISYYACAENIAYGETTPEAVVNQWKKSDGHNKNMLNSDYTHIGVGVYESGGYIYWVQLFVGSSSIYDDEYTPVYSPEGTTETTKPSEEYTTLEHTTEPTESSEEYSTWEYTTEPPETTEEYTTWEYTTEPTESSEEYTTWEYTTEPTESTEEYTTWEYTTEPTESSEEYTTWEYTTEPTETTEEYTTWEHTTEPTESSEEYTTWEYTTEPTETTEEYTTWEYTTEPTETTEEILTVSMWGDVTFDGRVSIADAVLLNRYLVNSATITKQGHLNADCWHDNKLTADDTVVIQKIIVGTYMLAEMPIIPN